MNIVLVTELFWGLGEENEYKLGMGTAAIYDLVKKWSTDNNIVCIREIPLGWKKSIIYRIRSLAGQKNIYKEVPFQYETDGIRIYTIKYLSYPHGTFFSSLFYKRFSTKINKILESIGYEADVIISHMPTFNNMYYIHEIAKGIPTVGVLHRSDLDKIFIRGRINENRVNILNKNFDAIFCRSKSIYNQVKEIQLNNLKQQIINSAVPLNQSLDRDWLLAKREIKLLYAGLLIEQKGIQQIIEAVGYLCDKYNITLTIVGTGKYEKVLQKLVEELELKERVFLVGRKKRQEVYEYMSLADIFVMVSKHETLGLVYLEAMGSGCITVGSQGEGIDGVIIDKKNGFLVKPLDTAGLTACLENIINMEKDKLEDISDEAIKTVMHYSEDNVAKEYFNAVQEVVEMNRGFNRKNEVSDSNVQL